MVVFVFFFYDCLLLEKSNLVGFGFVFLFFFVA